MTQLLEGKATLGREGAVQPVKASLKVKALVFISLMMLAVGASLSWYFLLQAQGVLTGELQRRALSLTKNLANASQYGVLTRDEVILRQLIEGILQEDSVLLVLITDAQGTVLAQGSRERTDAAAQQHAATLAMQDIAAPAAQVTAPSVYSRVIGKRGVYQAVAPVETTQTMPRERQQHLAAELFLMDSESGSAPNTAPQTVRRGTVQILLSPESMQADIRQTFITGIGLTLGIILVGVLIAFIYYSYTLTPVQAMARAAARIATGDLSQRVKATSRDEIGVLAMTFNHMAVSLESTYRELAQLNSGLEEKVQERTEALQRQQEQLQEANVQLEIATRHKSEFLANMSHELRTPMNAIIGFTRLVMRRAKDILPQRQYENLEKILLSAEHLLTLINDILDLSKIEAGQMEVRPVRLQLEGLVDVCLHTVEPLALEQRLHLVKEIEAALPLLSTDQDKLKQILMNLLSNAVKFTTEGTITISARAQDGEVIIAVTDTGIGIPAQAFERIFEEFRQVDSSPTRSHGGTGLGLSISRHLTRLLGGDITVQSTVGVGSTFTVTLPLHYGAAPLSPQVTAIPADIRTGSQSPSDRVVLAIDDDPDVIYLLRETLAEAGYRVVGAMNGEEGLRMAQTLRPFAITLDIMMPHKDGWQLLHDLKADVTTQDIPIIVLSIVDNKALGYHLGAFDYLLKPFDREAILAALARIPTHRGRLLVVDDDPQVTDLIRQYLEGEPYEVVIAADGHEALEAIARERPDVVLLDLLMPRLDGFAVIECLQRESQYRQLPVIVLTAKTLTAAERTLLNQGARTVFQKQGLDCEELIKALQGILQASRGPIVQA